MKLKFENVDVEQCLRSVMERNTKHYQSDFEIDAKSIRRIAQINHCEQTPLYWMSRPSGTWLLRERELFIRESSAFHIWQYYKNTRDTILAYTVEITGIEGDAIKGNLYTQDYRAMAEYIEKNAFPAATARVLFEGHLAPMKFTYEDYQANRLALQAKHGKEIKLWLEPADSAALDTLLQNVRRSRQNFAPGVFEDHLDKMIAAEKRSVTHFLKEAAANAPHPALNKKDKGTPPAMKAPKERRSAQIHILISEQEMDKIRERMAQTGITNTSAFIRKMAIDGYVINLDLSEVRELTRLLRICSNNLNQYARKAHETGSIYGADIADLQSRMDGLWKIAKKLLTEFTNIP